MPSFGLVSVDLWRPLSQTAASETATAVALLHEGVSIEAVNVRLAGLRAPSVGAGPRTFVGAARRVADHVGGGMRETLGLLMGAVVLLLLIACVNVSNLLLFRADARRRETAVRAALGGGRARLVRQMLVESVLLGVLGGALGVGLAYGGQEAILALRPERLTILEYVGVNGRVLGFALATALTAGVAFGMLPAIQACRPDALEPLRSGTRTEGDVLGRRVRWLLVTGEVALSFALLLGALQILSTLSTKQQRDVGYRASEVAVVEVTVPSWRYGSAEERAPVFAALVERASALPGVVHASLASALPPRAGITFGTVQVEGREPLEGTQILHGPAIDPEYFATVGQPLLEGRAFTRDDLAAEVHSVVIGEETAKRFFPEGDAVGSRFRMGSPGGDWMRVVGITRDVAMIGLSATERPLQAYFRARRTTSA